MGSLEREHFPDLPSSNEPESSAEAPPLTLTELHSRWLTRRRESWRFQKERLRDSVLVMRREDKEKEMELKSLYGTNVLFDDEGYLYIIQWQTPATIRKPELYAILWPPWVRNTDVTAYLERIPKRRPNISRAKLVKIRGLEEAIRMTRHVRESYLPEEGELTQQTRELIAQIRTLSSTFSRSRELTPLQIQELTIETRRLIESSGLTASRLPRVTKAVERVWRAATMKDKTGRLNPTACRQMLFSALIGMTQELEMKYPQVQTKYSSFEAAWTFERAQERWILAQARKGLSHFLQSAIYRHPHLLRQMTKRQLAVVKRGMIAYLRNISQELENQVRLRPYKPIAHEVILGIRGGEGYQKTDWGGIPAIEYVDKEDFGLAGRRLKVCVERLDSVLEAYKLIEKETT